MTKEALKKEHETIHNFQEKQRQEIYSLRKQIRRLNGDARRTKIVHKKELNKMIDTIKGKDVLIGYLEDKLNKGER